MRWCLVAHSHQDINHLFIIIKVENVQKVFIQENAILSLMLSIKRSKR